MRIYTRQEFMRLPEGTLFSKGKPIHFSRLMAKGETLFTDDIANDFCCLELLDWESSGTDDWEERFDGMLERRESYPMNDLWGRDGYFDEDDLFLVFEPADLDALSEIIATAKKVAPP